jgi:Family of unknown function (DUF5709)
MTHQTPPPDPRSRFEDEGIADLQDGTPEQQWAVDPQEAPPAAESVTPDGGLGPAADLNTDYQPDGDVDESWPAQPGEPSGQVWDEQRPAGRLVAPDEGAHEDTEPDEVAFEAGPDGGGYSAEEAAMRVEPD